MDLEKTITNIRASCNNYIDPNIFAFIISDDMYMGTNNILEIEGYGIENTDSYEKRLLKIARSENIFLPVGVMTFMPILNECDLFSVDDYHFDLTKEDFNLYSSDEEKLLGILVKKDSTDYIIGKTDVCSCSVDASFEKLAESDSEFYKKIKEIVESRIIS
ncbi:hypothetical protein [Methanobrevibacter sp.]|uniref:hypothetical protein n=1 Tax=Methanobrevibacter sp. TaxID=66852 RepID=UPI00388F1CEC